MGEATREAFESWLFDRNVNVPVHFWGDLDWSGMRILLAMRGSIPELGAWQPGYAPMLDNLKAGQGHSPEAAEKRGQQPVDATGCAYADAELLPEMRSQGRFIDQELFAL